MTRLKLATLTRLGAITLLATSVACSGDDGDMDAGTNDASTNNTNNTTPDAGFPPDSGPTPDGGEEVTLTGISVTPTSLMMDPGDTESLTVTAAYSDSSTEDVTGEATYASDDELVATVAAGTVTAVDSGGATITVSFMGETADVAVTVTGGPPPAGLVVFGDEYGEGVVFNDFGGSTNAITIDDTEAMDGTSSLRVEVPAEGYTGGAMALEAPADLTEYNAVSFWAKASAANPLNVTGIQNDATTTTYATEFSAVALTTDWQRFVIPIPNPSRLTAASGLFHFAEGNEHGAYTIWFDLIQYETLEPGVITNPQPAIPATTLDLTVGATGQVGPPALTVMVDGTMITVTPAVATFDFASDDTAIATVDADGLITAVAEGTATITGSLAGTDAGGAVTVNVGAAPTSLVVFDDDYATDVTFFPFGGSMNDVTIDTNVSMAGNASLRVGVPATSYTGGALRHANPQNLSGFNAISFWARADADNALNVTGLGNNGENTDFNAEFNGVPLTSTWTQFWIPIPDPAMLSAQTGLFHFAEGSEHGAYTIWFDDIQYVTLDPADLMTPRPAIATETASPSVGTTIVVNGTSVVYSVFGNDQVTSAARSYFTYASSDTAVATVDMTGTVTAVGPGTADITATLAGVAAAGALTVTPVAAQVPTTPAPTPPARMAADVISLFSDAYTDITLDTDRTPWSSGSAVTPITVGTDNVKQYASVDFFGWEFFANMNQVDATGMTHFHIDIWTPNATEFLVRLVDFGPNGTFDGGDDTNAQVIINAGSTPPLVTGQWISLDIPFTALAGLNRANLSQMVIDSTMGTAEMFIDNVYFYR